MLDRHTHAMLGYNYRMTEMEAAMGLVQLKKLDEVNAKRWKNTTYEKSTWMIAAGLQYTIKK